MAARLQENLFRSCTARVLSGLSTRAAAGRLLASVQPLWWRTASSSLRLCVVQHRLLSSSAATAAAGAHSPPSSAPPSLKKYYCLEYDYVENVLEKRAPYRPAHLELAKRYVDLGILRLGGAFDPPTGALLVFLADNERVVHEFVKQDPYVLNNIVTGFRVKPWTVVAGVDATVNK